MMGLPGREKKSNEIFGRLDTIREYEGQTDVHRPMASSALTQYRRAVNIKNKSIGLDNSRDDMTPPTCKASTADCFNNV